MSDREPGLGTGDYMLHIALSYGICWHAAHGGNWELAAYYLRRVRGIQRRLGASKEKYRAQLEEFDREALAPLMAAIEARDLMAFDRAYDRGVEAANRYHVLNDKAYIRWKRPERPPDDLELGPV